VGLVLSRRIRSVPSSVLSYRPTYSFEGFPRNVDEILIWRRCSDATGEIPMVWIGGRLMGNPAATTKSAEIIQNSPRRTLISRSSWCGTIGEADVHWKCRHDYDCSSVSSLRIGRRVQGDDSPAGRQVRLPSAATRQSRMTAKPSKDALRVDFPTRSTRAPVIPYSDLAAPAKNVSR
jgi:hypothetical protein